MRADGRHRQEHSPPAELYATFLQIAAASSGKLFAVQAKPRRILQTGGKHDNNGKLINQTGSVESVNLNLHAHHFSG